MKKNSLIIKYVVFSIILYIVSFFILSTVSIESSGSGLFETFDESMQILVTFIILISVIELIGGIYVLTKNLPKDILKKAFISLFILMIGLFIILYPLSFLLIVFIIPISSIIINYTAYDKKHIKIVFLIIFVLLLISVLLTLLNYIN